MPGMGRLQCALQPRHDRAAGRDEHCSPALPALRACCSGRSEGTAEVIYANKIDAERAMKRYNNVQLDGQAMAVRQQAL